ncbi:putative uncharacterized protein DDB_G0290521 [Eriocheir sinensis]|uniref:putative uncharacterized protein DDB_G0290521 n=1 Tax=Eriocheir sinensis TaxID=95602 RepID=UPI0021C632A4|nr:putative uncharacterized protein DDB_G0290521 [Eriocheir sinensis]
MDKETDGRLEGLTNGLTNKTSRTSFSSPSSSLTSLPPSSYSHTALPPPGPSTTTLPSPRPSPTSLPPPSSSPINLHPPCSSPTSLPTPRSSHITLLPPRSFHTTLNPHVRLADRRQQELIQAVRQSNQETLFALRSVAWNPQPHHSSVQRQLIGPPQLPVYPPYLQVLPPTHPAHHGAAYRVENLVTTRAVASAPEQLLQPRSRTWHYQRQFLYTYVGLWNTLLASQQHLEGVTLQGFKECAHQWLMAG